VFNWIVCWWLLLFFFKYVFFLIMFLWLFCVLINVDPNWSLVAIVTSSEFSWFLILSDMC
jgi:hypothetical protein